MIRTFPTLEYMFSREMTEGIASDPTLRSETENGTQLARTQFTTALRTWSYVLRMCTEEHWQELREFQQDVNYGALAFYWRHPDTNILYKTRFQEPLTSEQEDETDYKKITIKLVEACANSETA